MDINADFFLDFLKILAKEKVEFMLVGGYAVNYHGYSRFTGDLDLWSNPSEKNIESLIRSIDAFGFDTGLLIGKDLKNESPVKLAEDGIKIEILHHLEGGFSFEEAYERAKFISVENVEVKLISFDDLLANKSNSMRMKDAVDVHYLKEIQRIRVQKNS